MSTRKTVTTLIAGAAVSFSLALAPVALAGPAGDEYLPKVPQAAGSASAHSASGGSGETTLPQSTTGGNGSKSSNDQGNGKKKDNAANQAVPAGGSGSGGGGGGDSSGSILLNPIVLLMIAAVIAAAVGMTLRRRQLGDGEGDPESQRDPGASGAGSPRTPDGEIIAGRDKAA
ncbi:MAG TPA: hypothetical protein VHU24_06875 [Solirubrobacterales bacterium]|jgi:hypothetical protein|nr:hypothetical protein [Solirubrobacterales bacterium]